MPAPYSDDLYSDLPVDFPVQHPDVSPHSPLHSHSQSPEEHEQLYAADDEEDISHLLSPADGFHASSSRYTVESEPSFQSGLGIGVGSSEDALGQTVATPTSAGVPHIPNVMVVDPSLAGSTVDSKAREARRERSDSLNTPADPDAPDVPEPRGFSPSTSPQAPNTTTPANHSRHASSTSSGHLPSRSGSRQYNERSSLYNVPVEAPPAYSPSPTSPNSPDSQSQPHPPPSNYQTFPNIAAMGREEESRWLLSQQPESMGDAPVPVEAQGQGGGEGPFWRRPRKMSFRRNLIMRVLYLALLLAVIGAFIATIAKLVHHSRGASDDKDTKPHKPGDKKMPAPSTDLVWQSWPICAPGHHTQTTQHYDVSFGSQHDLTVKQTIQDSHRGRGTVPEVQGDIILRQVEKDKAAGVDVEILTNDASIQVSVEWDATGQALKIVTPRGMNWSGRLRPCIQMRITVRVPKSAELAVLSAGAVRLDISVEPDLDMKTTLMSLETISGDVVAKHGYTLDTRSIEIHTVSGDITGSLPLFDSLNLASASGNVDVSVDPKPVLDSNPLPAVLNIGTVSGNVKVEEPVDDKDLMPPRNYRVDIESYSGNVDARAAFTSKMVLESHSGKVEASVLPVLDDKAHNCGDPVMETQVYSGNMVLRMREPFWVDIVETQQSIPVDSRRPSLPFLPLVPLPPPSISPPNEVHLPIDIDAPLRPVEPNKPNKPSKPIPPTKPSHPHAVAKRRELVLGCLTSSHSSVSGDLTIKYPSSWSGRFAIDSISGTIVVRGKDVEMGSSYVHPDFKSVKGHKGDGGSAMTAAVISGDIDILIGRE